MMKAVLLDEFGPPEVMRIGELARPSPGPQQVLIKVAAAGVNRPDIIQREGNYPPPRGESEILGLEVAGLIEEIGSGVTDFAPGDPVFALVSGGAYAEFATAYASHVLPKPPNLSFEQAACICETYITAYMNVFLGARLKDGESVLLHGGGGGVNTAAIQLVKVLSPASCVIVTASPGKLDRVRALGADIVIDYKNQDFAAVVLAQTDKHGVDVILDHIGAPYLDANLRSLAVGGRLAIIATMGGREATLNLARLMVKRQTIMGSVLRSRPVAEKASIISQFAAASLLHFTSGRIVPLIFRSYAIDEVVEAHRTMEASEHFGKLVLRLD